MNCPYCDYKFQRLGVFGERPPGPVFAPIVCESCASVSLLMVATDADPRGPWPLPTIRKITPEELDAIKKSPAWRDVIEPAQKFIRGRQH